MRNLDEHGAALTAAAVRDVFAPSDLIVQGYDAADLARALIRYVDTSTEPDGVARWSLRTSIRARVLASRTRADVDRALEEGGPRIPTNRQRVFDRWIGRAPSDDTADVTVQAHIDALLDGPSPPPIEAIRSVAEWLRDAAWVTPRARDVLTGVARRELADRLQIAASAHFVGREIELDRLGHVVDGKSPHRIATIEAVGGMGKSALIAQMLIERRAYRADAAVLTAFLDFDDATINPRDPATLVAALCDQLTPQLGDLGGLQETLDAILAGGHSLTYDAAMSAEQSAEDSRLVSLVFSLRDLLIQRRAARPIVVVLDTVERALHRAGRLARPTLRMLWELLLNPIPGASLVLAGRTIPFELVPGAAESIALGPLDAAASRRVLVALGVPEARAARASALIVGVPLTLRLAARVLRDEGEAPLDDPALLDAVERARINGYLYRRVLAHLPDSRLSALADPGLMLRDLTAHAVLWVLGDTVEPAIVTVEEAVSIIDDLARIEDLLLTLGGREHRALRVRPDLRQDLIALLREANPVKFDEFHVRAASYYRKLHTRADYAAAAYHCLQAERLDEAAALCADEAVLSELADAVDELPPRAAAWLRERLQTTGGVRQESKLDRAVREADELEAVGRPARALETLLTIDVPPHDERWAERVVHLARLTQDVDRIRQVLADDKISPFTAAVASEVAGIPLTREVSRRVLDEARRGGEPGPNAIRALLVVSRTGGPEADAARDLLVHPRVKAISRKLAETDRDLGRRYLAEMGDWEDLRYALELELLDQTRDLDLKPVETVLHGDADALRLLEEGRREDKLSSTLHALMTRWPALEKPIRDLLLEAMDHPPPSREVPVTIVDRAGALDAVAGWIVKNVDRDEWQTLATDLVGRAVSRAPSIVDAEQAARFVLNAVDRRGRVTRFGKELLQRRPDAASLGPAFEMLSDEKKSRS